MADLKKSLVFALALGLGSAAFAQETTAPAADPAPTEAPAAEAPATDAPAAADTPATNAPAAEAPAEAPAADTPAEPDPNAIGATYTKETFGDWKLQCIRTEDGNDPCQMYQLMEDEAGNPVADISLFGLPSGQQAAAGATIMTPLETMLTENLLIKVDASEAKVYPFTFCARIGCFARVGFTQAEIDAFKKGSKAVMTVVPMAAPDQKVNLDMSLKGFTAAYDAVVKANAQQ